MTVVLALLSAACYGTSDFIGGVMAGRIPVWKAAFGSQVGGFLALVAISLVTGGDPSASDFAWAGLSGLATAGALVALYRGLAVGRMGVVAPVSGITGAIVPAVVGVTGGDRPSAVVWTGLLLALPAVVLVASAPRSKSEAGHGTGALYGVGAGVGFGMGFSTIAQISPDAGHWPVAVSMLVGALGTAGIAIAAGDRWWPRRAGEWSSAAGGVLGGLALVLFLAATTHGMLTVAAVLSSLYPAATVAWAVLLLHERIHRTQAIGLALCAAAVALVAAG